MELVEDLEDDTALLKEAKHEELQCLFDVEEEEVERFLLLHPSVFLRKMLVFVLSTQLHH